MNRKNFLKTASGFALLAAGATTGVSRVFVETDLMGHRSDPFTESQIDK